MIKDIDLMERVKGRMTQVLPDFSRNLIMQAIVGQGPGSVVKNMAEKFATFSRIFKGNLPSPEYTLPRAITLRLKKLHTFYFCNNSVECQ